MICKICISSDILGHNNSRQNKMEKERKFLWPDLKKIKNQEYLDYVNRTSPKKSNAQKICCWHFYLGV